MLSSETVTAVCNLRCSNHEPYLRVPDNQGGDSLLVRCQTCGLVFQEPRPEKQAIDAFYGSAALWTDSRDAEGHSRSYLAELGAKRPFFRDLRRRIERHQRGGKLLDVGCGPGLLQQELDPSHWEVTGVEPSAFIAEYGRRNLRATILDGTLQSLGLPEAHYDVIVMKYVLDHMEEPFEALVKARRLIKPGGVLVLADLINIDSFCARFFREGYRLIHPMHFTYFSPATIAGHLKRAGFRVTKIEYPFWNTPYATVSNLSRLLFRILQRGIKTLCGSSKRIFSVPFYGNMMDVWAVPAEESR